MFDIKKKTITASNNKKIATTIFHPKSTNKGVVIIAPALGVEQDYYQDFALWLVQQGFSVITFNYSAMGNPATESYKQSEVTITDWAIYDCQAILEFSKNYANNQAIYWIGHSLGGQITGMIPNINIVSKIVTIASGSGYWRENAKPLKKKVWFLWYFVAPILLKVLGYFPGKSLGMVGNLPYGVMKQWRKWCLHPEYLLGVESKEIKNAYRMLEKPITSFSFTDDQMMSAKNINSLHHFFAESQLNMMRFSPGEMQVKSIGHFGFFKETLQHTLWESHLLPELA